MLTTSIPEGFRLVSLLENFVSGAKGVYIKIYDCEGSKTSEFKAVSLDKPFSDVITQSYRNKLQTRLYQPFEEIWSDENLKNLSKEWGMPDCMRLKVDIKYNHAKLIVTQNIDLTNLRKVYVTEVLGTVPKFTSISDKLKEEAEFSDTVHISVKFSGNKKSALKATLENDRRFRIRNVSPCIIFIGLTSGILAVFGAFVFMLK
jgi:hypothetical protein